MALKNIVNQIKNEIKKEIKVVQGEATKDKVYSNDHTFADEATAQQEFERAKQKLFDVNGWTKLSGINSTFQLYDQQGQELHVKKPQVGHFFKIILLGTTIENWVQITDLREEPNLAEFVVHPSPKPQAPQEGEPTIKHFFIKEASSTFRVERQGNTLIGSEIGHNEGINNQGEEAGDRAWLNTLVAEGGWAAVQELQWDKLTRYLVHLEEPSQEDE